MEQDIFDDVVAGVSEVAQEMKLGPGLAADTEMGPLVSQEQLERVSGYIDAGLSDGACIATGGKRLGERGYFISPTVITDTTPEMSIVREEIFGPVVVAEPFGNVEDVLVSANNTDYGLAAGIWTRDISKAHRVAAHCAPAPSGSTASTSSMRRCPSAATSSPAGAARWATRPSTCTPRPRPSASACNRRRSLRAPLLDDVCAFCVRLRTLASRRLVLLKRQRV